MIKLPGCSIKKNEHFFIPQPVNIGKQPVSSRYHNPPIEN